ncbi:Cobalt-precorrin-2 C(20)-methyltransferase [Fundidesulfovibrio magnetotacticus]|uniref:Cobalt-precorrin-2 C(20)-methyltransferase n=1 Tax=Fundidesulfovibrio magnetotacticus TaxID=2730080 RepID=A0A6V8LWU3_9BACT|nr:precorrin-2 C(20)-methyltransferase [Fundidesulfovibrio magnetotacticus]GFK94738.1 Cobalt-precorrin-2 C(20)-methyltransferase [Fundidesulfovibrio magnetotacticus]
MSRGVLHAVGVGPGDPDLLTLKAVKALRRSGVVFAASSTRNDHSLALSIASEHLPPGTPVELLGFPMTRDQEALEQAWQANARRVLDFLDTGRDAAFITLGDPMTYSTFLYLWRTMREMDPKALVEVAPGVSSVMAAAAAAGVGLAESDQSLAVLSGVDSEARLRAAIEACDTAVILKAYRSYPRLRALLCSMGLENRAVLVSRVGLEGQRVHEGLPPEDKPPYFSLIIVKK